MFNFNHTLKKLALAAAAVILAATPSLADTYTYAGTTAGGPVFNRPLEDGSGLSAVGTSVRYNVLQFSVTIGGGYDFLSAPITAGFDNFLILYANSFNPLSPLANFRVADDDTGGIGVSAGFGASLTANTNYFLVTTGFNNADFGDFNNRITGPGVITPGAPIPEPATMLLLGTGLAGVGAAVRRRGRSGGKR